MPIVALQPETPDEHKHKDLIKRPLGYLLVLGFLFFIRWAPSFRGSEEVRTAQDAPVPADEAIERLKAGNRRYVTGGRKEARLRVGLSGRQALAEKGQSPLAAIVGCADSRAPIESIFDARPGDIFVLRNAGNTCTHGEGSIVGSLEFAVKNLGANVIIVMGHTKCGAMRGAAQTMLKMKESGYEFPSPEQEVGHANHGDQASHRKENKTLAEQKVLSPKSELESLLVDLSPVAAQAAAELPEDVGIDTIVALATKLNVFRSVDCILTHSKLLRDKVRSGELQVIGAIYELDSGEVDFMGESPQANAIVHQSHGVVHHGHP